MQLTGQDMLLSPQLANTARVMSQLLVPHTNRKLRFQCPLTYVSGRRKRRYVWVPLCVVASRPPMLSRLAALLQLNDRHHLGISVDLFWY
jgi:hypothetical protein